MDFIKKIFIMTACFFFLATLDVYASDSILKIKNESNSKNEFVQTKKQDSLKKQIKNQQDKLSAEKSQPSIPKKSSDDLRDQKEHSEKKVDRKKNDQPIYRIY
jgi:hypothetical protein